jgi:hypothetical protein
LSEFLRSIRTTEAKFSHCPEPEIVSWVQDIKVGTGIGEDPDRSGNQCALTHGHSPVIASMNGNDPMAVEDRLGDPVVLGNLIGFSA